MMSVLSTFRKMYKIFDYDGPEWCGWALYFPKTNVGAADQDGKACREAVERGVFFLNQAVERGVLPGPLLGFCVQEQRQTKGAGGTNVPQRNGCQWARRVTREADPVRERERGHRTRDGERVQHACRIAGFACGH